MRIFKTKAGKGKHSTTNEASSAKSRGRTPAAAASRAAEPASPNAKLSTILSLGSFCGRATEEVHAPAKRGHFVNGSAAATQASTFRGAGIARPATGRCH